MDEHLKPASGITPQTTDSPESAQLGPVLAELSWWSFQGRVGRGSFWGRNLLLSAIGFFVGLIIGGIAQSGGEGGGIIAILFYLAWTIVAGWLGLATSVKRWHDLGKSGWMVLLNFTIIAIPVTFIWQGFIRGTIGPNRFGADPLAYFNGTATN
jgi:uncharacterized membrane protein YhaH (DUF805 family)